MNKIHFIVKEARIENYPEISSIHLDCFEKGWGQSEILSLMGKRGTETICARVLRPRMPMVGFLMFRKSADELEVLSLCVLPEYRRKGIGKALLDSLVTLAPKIGTTRVFLEVRENNTNANSLYDKCGFKNVGKRKGYYTTNGRKSDAYVLNLMIKGKRSIRPISAI